MDFQPLDPVVGEATILLALIRSGRLRAADLCLAYRLKVDQRRRLGRLAVEAGFLKMSQVFGIVASQSELNKPFGETAIAMGLMTPDEVECVLRIQAAETLMILDSLVEVGLVTSAELVEVRHQKAENALPF